MSLAVLVEGAGSDAVEEVVEKIYEHCQQAATTAIPQAGGVVLSFESAAATGLVVDHKTIRIDGRDFALKPITCPLSASAGSSSGSGSGSGSPSRPVAEIPRPTPPLEEHLAVPGRAQSRSGSVASGASATQSCRDDTGATKLWPKDKTAERKRLCNVYPQLRRLLCLIGFAVGAALSVLGAVHVYTELGTGIDGYQLFARRMFPYWMVFAGLQIAYVELVRLKPTFQLGNLAPNASFRHRGSRALIFVLVGSLALDLGNVISMAVGFASMLTGCLNILFIVWGSLMGCLYKNSRTEVEETHSQSSLGVRSQVSTVMPGQRSPGTISAQPQTMATPV
uniref:Uncharacterized protein n=1 Tax=Eutreptiella gymnastica TaxID=73025 RepID=A0A7S4CYZ5_9EUGL|mmetsp:Transcript_75232/g.126593  ORF Transcript_75232/g.126593 Transcript_75232/m.126593 type:complete len:337 (+) Transcript_75232:42-1052(+)|eukprot:CAMPEP_0174290020 /NCGR_PEP_ID=MMETSP0809-20121228/27226_1 /TAXON_ID=73025 ORGANISM="Eutreptiella gymnastica-like, Strain CCMP1594" /NCGR_SAMPLE_ID=MMETSP0809 /ASSEMBLY_ACC=CAM_ASM_000658 /LENGTH=336 /DNA_ID=CAMNT_0015388377 /DNA_START=41 /DNA_END=1051 /DNA_ORIENTATION=+